MMVTRRNAVSQVVGFMSLENGLVLAATGAKGMPLVVEISVAFSVLIAFIVIGIFLFRIRERFDTVDMQALDALPGRARDELSIRVRRCRSCSSFPRWRRWCSRCCRAIGSAPTSMSRRAFLTFLAALVAALSSAGARRLCAGRRLNIVFVVLTTFVGFTTSVFSASYIAHELETGRLTPAYPALLPRACIRC